jgi:hypothetical protein
LNSQADLGDGYAAENVLIGAKYGNGTDAQNIIGRSQGRYGGPREMEGGCRGRGGSRRSVVVRAPQVPASGS